MSLYLIIANKKYGFEFRAEWPLGIIALVGMIFLAIVILCSGK